MRLLSQSHSPYARKVLVAAHEAGLIERLEVVHHETSPTRRNEAVHALNPLGKVPVLILDDGATLFDSNVICDYLDHLQDGGLLLPTESGRRFAALRLQALANGLCEAGTSVRWEALRRPEPLRWTVMQEAQTAKLAAAYDFIEANVTLDGAFDLGQIALATALDWIAFRDLLDFRQGRPLLAGWFERVVARPSMRATTMSGETHD